MDVLRGLGHVKAGWTVANQVFQAVPGYERERDEWGYWREDFYLEQARGDDFIGVQSYLRTIIGADGPVPFPDDVERTLTGWEYYPEALGHALRHTREVTGGVPMLVTENGMATADDSRRIDYTTGALQSLAAAVADGCDVRGYLHWSLLDNYEWGSFRPTFGLIGVDRQTFDRAPKPSLAWLGRLAQENVLPAP
jgi:beta-glucosidase